MKTKRVMFNGIDIGAARTLEEAAIRVCDFATNLFAPLFNDGRAHTAQRFAALTHLAESLRVTHEQLNDALTRQAAEGPSAFYIELGKPAEPAAKGGAA